MRRRSSFRKRTPASQSEGTTRVFLGIRVPLDEPDAGVGEADSGSQSHDSLRRGLLRELLHLLRELLRLLRELLQLQMLRLLQYRHLIEQLREL